LGQSVAEVARAIPVPFADVSGVYSRLAQTFAQGRQISMRTLVIAEHSVAVGKKSGENRRTRGTAHWGAGIGAFKPNARRGKSVDMGSAESSIPRVVTELISSLGIDQEENGLISHE
jgi:hypothetical protein